MNVNVNHIRNFWHVLKVAALLSSHWFIAHLECYIVSVIRDWRWKKNLKCGTIKVTTDLKIQVSTLHSFFIRCHNLWQLYRILKGITSGKNRQQNRLILDNHVEKLSHKCSKGIKLNALKIKFIAAQKHNFKHVLSVSIDVVIRQSLTARFDLEIRQARREKKGNWFYKVDNFIYFLVNVVACFCSCFSRLLFSCHCSSVF